MKNNFKILVLLIAILSLLCVSLVGCSNDSTYLFGLVEKDDDDNNSYYNVVDFKLTYNEDDIDTSKGQYYLANIYINIATLDTTTNTDSFAFRFYSGVSTTSISNSSYGLGIKTLSNTSDNLDCYVDICDTVQITSTSRYYIRIATQNVFEMSEVVFVDSNGTVLEAEVISAGLLIESKVTTDDFVNSEDDLAINLNKAKKLLDNQEDFEESKIKVAE